MNRMDVIARNGNDGSAYLVTDIIALLTQRDMQSNDIAQSLNVQKHEAEKTLRMMRDELGRVTNLANGCWRLMKRGEHYGGYGGNA